MFSTDQDFIESRSVGRRKEDFLIREEVSRHRRIFQLSKAVTSEMNREALFQVIMDQTNQVMGTEKSLVFLHQEEKEELWSMASAGNGGDGEIRLPAGQGVVGWVLENQAPLLINDAYSDPRFSDELDRRSGFRTRNLLSIPLVNLQNRIIGVFQTLNKKEGGFKEEDITLLTSLSIYVAIALENSKLYEEIKSLHKAKERCIAHLSHELRTPLSIMDTVLLGLSKEVQNTGIPGLGKLIDRGFRSLRRLFDIQVKIDDILNQNGIEEKSRILHLIEGALAIVEDERMETLDEDRRHLLDALSRRLDGFVSMAKLENRRIDLEPFLGELCREAERMGEREVEIVRDVEAGSALWMDPGILRKVCGGLLRNAVENTPDGGRIEIRAGYRDRGLAVEVQDFGVGITEENTKLIFGGFFHTQETKWYSSKRPYQFDAGGAGVDLLRTKVFSERYGFSVSFESRRCRFIPRDEDQCPGKVGSCTLAGDRSECLASGGSTFSLLFPRKRPACS